MKSLLRLSALLLSTIIAIVLAEWVAKNFAYIDTPPGLYQKSITRNFQHKPNFKGRDRYKNPIAINSKGLRDSEYPDQPTNQGKRIFVLGDSVTFADGLSAEYGYVKALERSLRGLGKSVDVINGGVRGYNTVHEKAMLEEVGFSYNPDLVVLGYVLNDAEPVSAQQGLISPKYGFLIQIKDWIKAHSYLYSLFRRNLELARHAQSAEDIKRGYDSYFEKTNKGWRDSVQALSDIQNLCKKRGVRFLLIIFPKLEKANSGYTSQWIHDQITSHCRQMNIDYLDLKEVLLAHDPKTLQISPSDTFHPNKLGHEIAARAITEYLVKKRYV